MTKSEFIQRATIAMVGHGEHQKIGVYNPEQVNRSIIKAACDLADQIEEFTDFDEEDVCSENDIPTWPR